uniref:N-acetylmuramoyl-L-alanine amidase domain-containing protein n=1 Tax=Panagrolaimus sp. ES5 TaxID=591445 RepID=A0AC34F3F5_9BILA
MVHQNILCFLFLLPAAFFFSTTNGIPITDAYPGVFSPDPEIEVTSVNIHGVSGFAINPFPANESNRNHYDSRKGKTIKYLIMHFTEENFTRTVNIFTNNSRDNPTSAHYVITQKEVNNLAGGQVLRVVPEELRAWHAGTSSWGNDTSLNYVSIGIEHVNLGFNGNVSMPEMNRTYFPYDDDEIAASGQISRDIVKQYGILPQHVIGHEDVQPAWKPDPGPLFPWGKFYHQYGVGAWLDDDEMNVDAINRKYSPPRAFPQNLNKTVLLDMLYSYGFRSAGDEDRVILAFKKHFSANQYPALCDGIIRVEDMFWAWALEAKYVTGSSTTATGLPPTGSSCVDAVPDCLQYSLSECQNSLYKPIMCKYCKVRLFKIFFKFLHSEA